MFIGWCLFAFPAFEHVEKADHNEASGDKERKDPRSDARINGRHRDRGSTDEQKHAGNGQSDPENYLSGCPASAAGHGALLYQTDLLERADYAFVLLFEEAREFIACKIEVHPLLVGEHLFPAIALDG